MILFNIEMSFQKVLFYIMFLVILSVLISVSQDFSAKLMIFIIFMLIVGLLSLEFKNIHVFENLLKIVISELNNYSEKTEFYLMRMIIIDSYIRSLNIILLFLTILNLSLLIFEIL